MDEFLVDNGRIINEGKSLFIGKISSYELIETNDSSHQDGHALNTGCLSMIALVVVGALMPAIGELPTSAAVTLLAILTGGLIAFVFARHRERPPAKTLYLLLLRTGSSKPEMILRSENKLEIEKIQHVIDGWNGGEVNPATL